MPKAFLADTSGRCQDPVLEEMSGYNPVEVVLSSGGVICLYNALPLVPKARGAQCGTTGSPLGDELCGRFFGRFLSFFVSWLVAGAAFYTTHAHPYHPTSPPEVQSGGSAQSWVGKPQLSAHFVCLLFMS